MTHEQILTEFKHRVRFYMPDGTRGGSPGSGSCLIAFGERNVKALEESGLTGFPVVERPRWRTPSACRVIATIQSSRR